LLHARGSLTCQRGSLSRARVRAFGWGALGV
jgi:hypothetical protein